MTFSIDTTVIITQCRWLLVIYVCKAQWFLAATGWLPQWCKDLACCKCYLLKDAKTEVIIFSPETSFCPQFNLLFLPSRINNSVSNVGVVMDLFLKIDCLVNQVVKSWIFFHLRRLSKVKPIFKRRKPTPNCPYLCCLQTWTFQLSTLCHLFIKPYPPSAGEECSTILEQHHA